jgi:hypothetical protein
MGRAVLDRTPPSELELRQRAASGDMAAANELRRRALIEQQQEFERRFAAAKAARALTEDERWARYALADVRRADRLAAMTPRKFEDKARQHQGEFTNNAANYDDAREAEGHR